MLLFIVIGIVVFRSVGMIPATLANYTMSERRAPQFVAHLAFMACDLLIIFWGVAYIIEAVK